MSELLIERICEEPQRLDVFVSEAADITRSRAGPLIPASKEHRWRYIVIIHEERGLRPVNKLQFY